jgi:uncharacterized protein (DUF952 family)
VLRPPFEFEYRTYCERKGIPYEPTDRDGKWLNARCDVQALWSHIHAKNQVFVTSARHFHTQTARKGLLLLGAGAIETPDALLLQTRLPV